MHGTMVRPMPQGDNRAWYVLRVSGNREGTVRQFFSPTDDEIAEAGLISRQLEAHLIARRFKVYVPMERKKVTRGIKRKKVIIERPLFIGYAFIRLDWQADEDRLKHIRTAPGVIGFVQLGRDYAVISDRDMAKIGEAESAERDLQRRRPWSLGDKVRVNDGPFSGFPATVFQMSDNERVKALVDIFGRKTPVEFDEDELEKL